MRGVAAEGASTPSFGLVGPRSALRAADAPPCSSLLSGGPPRLDKTHGAAPGFMASSTCPSPTATGGCDWAAQPAFSNRPKGSWLGFPWQTLWSKQRIASNSAAAFVSCFVPYEAALGKAAAQAVAKSIEIQLAASDDSATVKLTPDGATKQLTVTLDIHGKWTVSR